MKTLAKLFLRGLAAILPLALTGYLVWLAVVGSEEVLHSLLIRVLRPEAYSPLLGFTIAIAFVLLVGLLMYSWVVRTLYRRLTGLIERIPVVKSVYGMLVDVVRLLGSADERPFRQVVLVRLDTGLEQLGFLTREDCTDVADLGGGHVAIYLPMSYQLGGFTVLVARDRVRRIDMSVEQALRFCITAGVSQKAAADG